MAGVVRLSRSEESSQQYAQGLSTCNAVLALQLTGDQEDTKHSPSVTPPASTCPFCFATAKLQSRDEVV